MTEPRKIYSPAKRGRKIEIARDNLELIREQMEAGTIDTESGKTLAYMALVGLLRSVGLGQIVTEYERIKRK